MVRDHRDPLDRLLRAGGLRLRRRRCCTGSSAGPTGSAGWRSTRIGPFWDGNEVWLVVGGAAIFAAFPDWYATWFSASYLAVLLLLVALIVRGVSFEFRGKVDRPGWRRLWSGTLTIGSLLAPLVLGIALGDLVAGLPIDADGEFTGHVLGSLHAVRPVDRGDAGGALSRERGDVPRHQDHW